MRFVNWEKSTPNEYFGFTHYTSSADTCAHIWLNFRHENFHDDIADSIRDFGVYVWLGKDNTISFTSKFHDIHSADLPKLQSMAKFLKKHSINSPFYKLEGREHLKLLLRDVFAQLKVTKHVSYPSETVKNLEVTTIADQIIQYANMHWRDSWNF